MNKELNGTTMMAANTQHSSYALEIVEVIRSNSTPKLLKKNLLEYHENDIAEALNFLKKDELQKLYNILEAEMLANILEYSDNLTEQLQEMNIRKRIEVLSHLEITQLVSYLQSLEKQERNILLNLLNEDLRDEVRFLSSFGNEEIGSKMTTNYISISSNCTIRQAMSSLIEQAAENDNIGTIYVIDEQGILVGAIDLKDLIIARENEEIDSIIMTSYPYVYANEQIDECIERIKDYSEDSIPVLDLQNRLKGVLTAQDIVQLVDEEMGDDYAKLAGLTAEEDLNEPLKKSIQKRLPWLIVLLGLGMVVSSVVGMFETVVSHLAILVCFQALVLDMAGNVGTQSLAVTIRVLMDENMSGKEKIKLIGKETKVGLVNGWILGVFTFLFIGLYLMFFKNQSMIMSFSVSLCTAVALLVSMVLSSICGTVIPIFLKKIKIDPAVASGPLITTINDLVAVVAYYGLAWILLINVLKL